jgi:hypothetical protein
VGDARGAKRTELVAKIKKKTAAASIVNPRAKRHVPKKAKIGE